jgi:hypothetical protein
MKTGQIWNVGETRRGKGDPGHRFAVKGQTNEWSRFEYYVVSIAYDSHVEMVASGPYNTFGLARQAAQAECDVLYK